MTHFAGKLARAFLISTVSSVLLAGFAMAAESEQAIAVGATTGSSLRLREAPSTEAAILNTLDKDVAVAVLADNTDGWYKVAYNGKTGFISADYMVIDQDNMFTTYGRVNGTSVNVRSGSSTDSEILASVDTGTIVTVNGFENGWYDVTCKYGTEGYIRSDFLDLTASAEAAAPSASGGGIVSTAMQHLGTPYVWGASAPGGFDCSGFTSYIYRQHGYSLPRTASGQWESGMGTRIYSLSELQPGDLVFFNDPSRSNGKSCSHAGIYIGGGQHVHSSSAKNGVIISDMTSGYYNRYFVGGIRI